MSGRKQLMFSCGLEGLSWATKCLHLEKNSISYHAMVSYFDSGECNKLLHFTLFLPQIVHRRPGSCSKADLCSLHLGSYFETHDYFGGMFECCSTPSAPSGQPLLRHWFGRRKLGTNGSVSSGLTIFYYWGDFCFCSHKLLLLIVRRLWPSARSTPDAWGPSCVTCLPCTCSLIVILPPVHSHPSLWQLRMSPDTDEVS